MSRLEEIFKYTGTFDSIIDVGCDHGYLGLMALERTTARVVFSDISQKCLQKAISNVGDKYKDRVEFLVCDGVPDRPADVAIIAGMGGRNILRMCKRPFNIDRLVLQPMNYIEELREYLYTHFVVETDDIIKEGEKFYTVIVIKNEKSNIQISDETKFFGVINGEISDNKREYLLYKKNKLKNHIAFNHKSMLQLECINRLLESSKV